jgi:hypothetical protein
MAGADVQDRGLGFAICCVFNLFSLDTLCFQAPY